MAETPERSPAGQATAGPLAQDGAAQAVAAAALQALAAGRLAEAEALLAPHEWHPSPRLAYLRGLLALAQGDPVAARAPLQRAAQALPADAAVQSNWSLCLFQCDQASAALEASDRALALAPRHADGHYNRGLILLRLNRLADAAQALAEATSLQPAHAQAWRRLGEVQHARGHFLAAEVALRKALDLRPDDPALHARLAAVCYDAGHFSTALALAERACSLDAGLADGWEQASQALRRLGRLDEAETAVARALTIDGGRAASLKARALIAQMRNRLDQAARDFAAAVAISHRPGERGASRARQHRQVSRAKLVHDIEQFEHLAAAGQLADGPQLATLHGEALAALPPTSRDAEVIDLPADLLDRLDGHYNRLHRLDAGAPIAGGALAAGLDAAAIQAEYAAREPGIVVIDELLRPETLAALRRYCLDSTVWFDFHHANGYLGAFFEDGFAAPVLLQVAEELRLRFPAIFRDYPLTQLWAFKYDSRLDGIELHADIAAVNLNFWITPDDANLDPDSGGLVVWDKEAPADWSFDEFNTSTAAGQARIEEFLRQSGARAVRVPYRQNRAVLFNSDLFHRTDTIRFREGYANRRINITMLFGQRVGRTR